jgi:hypothetical protein
VREIKLAEERLISDFVTDGRYSYHRHLQLYLPGENSPQLDALFPKIIRTAEPKSCITEAFNWNVGAYRPCILLFRSRVRDAAIESREWQPCVISCRIITFDIN